VNLGVAARNFYLKIPKIWLASEDSVSLWSSTI
jgi:hypothetical protein